MQRNLIGKPPNRPETDAQQPVDQAAALDPLLFQISVVDDAVHAAEQEHRGETCIVDRPYAGRVTSV